jgi:hypothetical protein
MPAEAPPHLGIPLLSETFPEQHYVGVRYWNIGKDDALGAPCGIGLGTNWAPGLNTGACPKQHRRHSHWFSCTCGLYCYKWGKDVEQTGYFNMQTGVAHAGPDAGVMGGIAYWLPRNKNASPGVEIVSAKYAAVGALTIPKGASKKHERRIVRLAERYNVEIVKPTELGDAVDQWVAEKLPNFYERPPRPLFELLGRTERYQAQNRWSIAPPPARPPAFGPESGACA